MSREADNMKARICDLEEENKGLLQQLLEMSKIDEEYVSAQRRLESPPINFT